MSCVKSLYNVAAPCCRSIANRCRWIPEVDFSTVAWLVSWPDAKAVEVRRVADGIPYPGQPSISLEGESQQWAFEGIALSGGVAVPGVLHSWHGWFFRASQQVVANAGQCQWTVLGRERLAPIRFALLAVDDVLQGADDFAPNTVLPNVYTLIDPDGTEYPYSEPLHSWRDILKAIACTLVPSGAELTNAPGIEGGGMLRYNSAKAILQNNLRGNSRIYQPTAMDRAVEWTLTRGFSFGFEPHRSSPYHGRLMLLDDATITQDGRGGSYISATPWEPVSEFAAEFGHTNRFERTDNRDWLPEWVTVELIPYHNEAIA